MSSEGPKQITVVSLQSALENPALLQLEPSLHHTLNRVFHNATHLKELTGKLINIAKVHSSTQRANEAAAFFEDNKVFLAEHNTQFISTLQLHFLQNIIPYFRIHERLTAMEQEHDTLKVSKKKEDARRLKDLETSLAQKYSDSEKLLLMGFEKATIWHLILSASPSLPQRAEIVDSLCADLCHGLCALTKRFLSQKLSVRNYFDYYQLLMEKVSWFCLYADEYAQNRFKFLTENAKDETKLEETWELFEALQSTYKAASIMLMYFGHQERANALSIKYNALLDKLFVIYEQSAKKSTLDQLKTEAKQLSALGIDISLSPWRKFLINAETFYQEEWCKTQITAQEIALDSFKQQCLITATSLLQPDTPLLFMDLNQVLVQLLMYKSLSASQKTTDITQAIMKLSVSTLICLNKTPALAQSGSLSATLMALMKKISDDIGEDLKKSYKPSEASAPQVSVDELGAQLQQLKLEPRTQEQAEQNKEAQEKAQRERAEHQKLERQKAEEEKAEREKAQREQIAQDFAKREKEAKHKAKQLKKKIRKEAQRQLEAQEKQLISDHETKLAALMRTFAQEEADLNKKLNEENTVELEKLQKANEARLSTRKDEQVKKMQQLSVVKDKAFEKKRAALALLHDENIAQLDRENQERIAALQLQFREEVASLQNSQQIEVEKLKLSHQETHAQLQQTQERTIKEQKQRLEQKLALAQKEQQLLQVAQESLAKKEKKSIYGFTPIRTIELPPLLRYMLEDIAAEDIECYGVGGYVRNRLLNLPEHPTQDIDFILNCHFDALPAKIKRHFQQDFHDARRVKLGNIDFWCEPWTHLPTALSKRDFTINTFICDINGNCYDLLNYKEDLTSTFLNLIGDIESRFTEDPSLIIRMIRICNQTEKIIHPDVLPLVQKHAAKIKTLALGKYFTNIAQLISPVASKNLFSITHYGLLHEFFPMLPKVPSDLDPYLVPFWYNKVESLANQKAQIDGYHVLGLFMLLPLLLKNPSEQNWKEHLKCCVDEFFSAFKGEYTLEDKQKTYKSLESIMSDTKMPAVGVDKEKNIQGLLSEFYQFRESYQYELQPQPLPVTHQFEQHRRSQGHHHRPQKKIPNTQSQTKSLAKK